MFTVCMCMYVLEVYPRSEEKIIKQLQNDLPANMYSLKCMTCIGITIIMA